MVNSHKIKCRIFELGLSQKSIAISMGIEYSTLNLKINNKRPMYIDEVVKLCKILDITTSVELKEFFGLDFLIIPNSCENDTKEIIGGA